MDAGGEPEHVRFARNCLRKDLIRLMRARFDPDDIIHVFIRKVIIVDGIRENL